MRRTKVEYTTLLNYQTTAYIDEDAGPDGIHVGVNKHTDDPVWVRWDGSRWLEVAIPTATPIPDVPPAMVRRIQPRNLSRKQRKGRKRGPGMTKPPAHPGKGGGRAVRCVVADQSL